MPAVTTIKFVLTVKGIKNFQHLPFFLTTYKMFSTNFHIHLQLTYILKDSELPFPCTSLKILSSSCLPLSHFLVEDVD